METQTTKIGIKVMHIIYSCEECRDGYKADGTCKHTGKDLNNDMTIPEWCPKERK